MSSRYLVQCSGPPSPQAPDCRDFTPTPLVITFVTTSEISGCVRGADSYVLKSGDILIN